MVGEFPDSLAVQDVVDSLPFVEGLQNTGLNEVPVMVEQRPGGFALTNFGFASPRPRACPRLC